MINKSIILQKIQFKEIRDLTMIAEATYLEKINDTCALAIDALKDLKLNFDENEDDQFVEIQKM